MAVEENEQLGRFRSSATFRPLHQKFKKLERNKVREMIHPKKTLSSFASKPLQISLTGHHT
jgi:hypothetical protein